MSMAVHENLLRVGRQQLSGCRTPQLVSMTHVDGEVANGYDELLFKTRIVNGVGVSINRHYRGNNAQLVEDLVTSNITCVKNELDSRQSPVNGRTKEPVRIGDKSDDYCRRVIGHASYITRVCHGRGLSWVSPVGRLSDPR